MLVVPSPHVMVVLAKSESGAAASPSVNVALVVKATLVCCAPMTTAGPGVSGASATTTDPGPDVTEATLLAVYCCSGGSVTVTVGLNGPSSA